MERPRVLLLLIALVTCQSAGAQTIMLNNQLGHSGRVSTVSISPNGKLLLTGGYDKTARLWDFASGLEVGRFQVAGIPNVAAFSPDGHFFLTAGGDSEATLWDISKEWAIAHFKGHQAEVTCAAFSVDGRFVLTGSADRTARLWDRTTGKELQKFDGHVGMITSVGFSADGHLILTASADATVRLWDPAGHELRRLHGPLGMVKSALLTPDERFVLVVLENENNGAFLLDAGTGATARSFNAANTSASFIALSKDGRFVVTAAKNKTAQVWELATGRQISQYDAPRGTGPSAFTPDGHSVVTATFDNAAVLWNTSTGKALRSFEGVANRVQGLGLSQNSQFLATGSEDGTASVWDLSSGARVHHLDAHAGAMFGVGFSPDGHSLVTGSSHEITTIWNLDTGTAVQRLQGSSGAIYTASFSPDGHAVLTGSAGRVVQLEDIVSRNVIQDFTLPLEFGWLPTAAAMSTDGKTVLTAAGGNDAHLWSGSSGPPRTLRNHTDMVGSVALSSDGKWALTGSIDNTARLWSVATATQIQKYSAPSGVHAVAFSADNNRALVGDFNGNIQIMDIASGNPVAALRGHSDAIAAAAYSGNGKFIATGSYDGTTRLWAADGKPLVALISSSGDTWATVDLDGSGRFDTNALDNGAQLYWIVSDQPLRPLPLDIFMRDFYEPRLAARLMPGSDATFDPVPNLTELNRVQPLIEIRSVRRGARADEALVDVWVANNTDPTQTNGKTTAHPHDLRLFRDGELVGQWPDPRGSSGGPEELGAWQKATSVKMPLGAGSVTHTFHVKLASFARGQPVTFSAYAFNQERVKSPTVTNDKYLVPQDIVVRPAKAYVLTIGINKYTNDDLEFAVQDAKTMRKALQAIAGREVFAVTLVSDVPQDSHTPDQATKDNIRSVLRLLAGAPNGEAERQRLLAAGLNKETVRTLNPATPDDVVIITYSGHGYTRKDGAFYLLPADSWSGDPNITPEDLTRFISSEELSEWLRPVDAGELALIIDACHSAASFYTPGFKPGPMGDRGLGQLAYDKGIRILAATQANNVALEASSLHEGVLTYALVEDGLTPDSNGRLAAAPDGGTHVSLVDWLQYAVRDTPKVYERVVNGKVNVVSRDSVVNNNFIAYIHDSPQTPALFDFQRTRDTVVLTPR